MPQLVRATLGGGAHRAPVREERPLSRLRRGAPSRPRPNRAGRGTRRRRSPTSKERPRSAESSAVRPGSIRSVFVSTPIVRSPARSTSLANTKASDVAKSAFAALTQSNTALGFLANCWHNRLILSPMSSGWPRTGTRVTPGKSTKVKEGAPATCSRNTMGVAQMSFSSPASLAVCASISALIASISLIGAPPPCPN